MTATVLKLPIGEEFFSSIRKKGFYYVDKTGFIGELLRTRGSVNFFTRPRRFGKSLNMDMLRCFFEVGTDSLLFEGLEIAKDTELCKLEDSTETTKEEIETLISGGHIEKRLAPELTYTDLNSKDKEIRQTYLWSVLFATGYLTEAATPSGRSYCLKIPNKEILEIYEDYLKYELYLLH